VKVGAAWPKEMIGALHAALGRSRLRGRMLVTTLPDSLIRYQSLRLAAMPESEIETAAFWQVAKELSLAPEDLRVACLDLGMSAEGERRGRRVIAVTASRRDVVDHAQSLCAAGFVPMGIDAAPVAIARCFAPLPAEAESESARLVIALGLETTHMLVVRKGEPRFIRAMEGGQQRIAARLSEMPGAAPTDVTELWAALQGGDCARAEGAVPSDRPARAAAVFASELAHEVGLCLHFLSTHAEALDQPRTGCLVGAGGLESAMLGQLCRDLEFAPVASALPALIVNAAAEHHGGGPLDAWLPAIGLSLYDLASGITESAA